MTIKKIIFWWLLIFLLLWSYLNFSYWLSVSVPSVNSPDVVHGGWGNISGWVSNWKIIANIVTDYIWIALIVFAMVLLMRWGYDLVVSEWKEEELKKTNNKLIYGLVWIVVSISSYFIMTLLMNLF